MHELSLAQSIVEIVEEHVLPNDRQAVREVKVKVGENAGVVPDSLEFCFNAITADTLLENAKLHVLRIPFTINCEACGVLAASAFGACPQCGGVKTTVISGTELHVEAIELADSLEPV